MDIAYCPTCQIEQPLKLKETVPGVVLKYWGKECTACGRAFTFDNKTYVIPRDY